MRPFRIGLLIALLLVAPAALAGCLESPPGRGGADATSTEDDAGNFTTGALPFVAWHAWPTCGFCAPSEGYENPQWRAFAVYANGRAILVHYNAQPGDATVQLASGVNYDEAELTHLFAPDRGGILAHASWSANDTAWVAHVERGIVSEDTLRELTTALTGHWAEPPEPTNDTAWCMDCAGPGHYGKFVPAGGADVVSPPLYHPDDPAADDPDYRRVVDAFDAALQAAFPDETGDTDPDGGTEDPGGTDGVDTNQTGNETPSGPSGTSPGAADGDRLVLHAGAHDNPDNGSYWFTFGASSGPEGFRIEEGRNPTLHIAPGMDVAVHLVNRGEQAHNLRVGPPVDEATAILSPGENATLTFRVPDDASGEIGYWCDPHQALGMSGRIVVDPSLA